MLGDGLEARIANRTVLVGLQHKDFDPRLLGYDEVHGLGFLPRALEVSNRVAWWYDQPRSEQPALLTIGMWEVHRPWPVEDYDPADPALVDVPPYLPDNESTRADIADFHGSIRQMDQAVGQILDAIRRGGRETLVIFTTDHGVAFPRAKSTLYDSGVKVSFIVSAPTSFGAVPVRRSRTISHLDIVPTLVEVAGGVQDPELEGRSFLSELRSPVQAPDDRELLLEKSFHDRYDPIRAIRTPTAKYIRNFEPGPRLPLPIDLEESKTRAGLGTWPNAPRETEELYLLDEDPWELVNVIHEPEHRALRERLAAQLLAEMERTADPLLDGAIPAPPPPSRA